MLQRQNEEIDILKTGLSGIAKKYGYKNVQEFYRIYHKAEEAYAAYQKDMAKWKKRYEKGSSKKVRKSIRERLKTPSEQKFNIDININIMYNVNIKVNTRKEK